MAQRASGYARQPDDRYETPSWCVDALAEHVALRGLSVWEPCAASGQLATALEAHTQVGVWRSDLVAQPDATSASRTQAVDFLHARLPQSDIDAIISNPPWGSQGRLAVAFIEHALKFLRESEVRLVAFLLAVDFDSAATRTALFAYCPEFALKVVLLKRIKWFEGPSGPSTNHAWYCWVRSPLRTVAQTAVTRYAPARDSALSANEL